VNTSSEAHRISPVRFSDIGQDPEKKVAKDEEPRRGMTEGVLRGNGGYEPAVAYGQSKTANVLFAVGLNARGVKSFAVMPGSESSLLPVCWRFCVLIVGLMYSYHDGYCKRLG
jgi:hypothetical protein